MKRIRDYDSLYASKIVPEVHAREEGVEVRVGMISASLPANEAKKKRQINWAASCEKGPDDIFCPFLVLSLFSHFIPQIA